MTHLHYCYSLLWCLFASVFSSTLSSTTEQTTFSTTLTTIDSVTEGSDYTPHTLHSSAIPDSPLPPDNIPHKGHHPRTTFNREQISMNIISPQDITTRQQWHAWFEQRRRQLKRRLEQAEHAEWNWPSSRRRVDVLKLEIEIRNLDAEEFVVPF